MNFVVISRSWNDDFIKKVDAVTCDNNIITCNQEYADEEKVLHSFNWIVETNEGIEEGTEVFDVTNKSGVDFQKWCHIYSTLPGWEHDSTVESEAEYDKKVESGLYQHTSYVKKTFNTQEEALADQRGWLAEDVE